MAGQRFLEKGDEVCLMGPKGVATTLNIGQRTLWRWISIGVFPPPDISIGAKVRRWRRESVLAWIEEQSRRCDVGNGPPSKIVSNQRSTRGTHGH